MAQENTQEQNQAQSQEITWNGNTGRMAGGREFRKSEDGHSIYERVGDEYVPYAGREAGAVDTDTITWSGDYGRNATGRRFRKSGDLLYEYVDGKYIPLNKPEVASAPVDEPVTTELAASEPAEAESTGEEWRKDKLRTLPMPTVPREQLSTGYKSIEQNLPNRNDYLYPLEDKSAQPEMKMSKKMSRRNADGTETELSDEEMRRAETLAFLEKFANRR